MGINTIDRSTDQFLLDAYSGKGGFLTGNYLIRHARETDDKFKERQALAEYPNYVRKIINIYSGFLFKRQPNREGSATYDQFTANADGAGASLDSQVLSYQRLAALLGTVYVIVDKPKGEATSRATDGAPYLALRLPGALSAHKKDSAGRFLSATFSELNDSDEIVYRQFNTDGWRLCADADGTEIIDQGDYTLGRVPVVRLHSTIPVLPTDIRATAWSHDITQANWALFNLVSEFRELLRKQTFSILTIPVTSDDEAQRLTSMKVSTENAIAFNPAGGGRPDYIAPPAEPANIYINAIAGTETRIYKQANLEFVGGVASSGVERKYQFAQTNNSVVEMAMLVEQAEIEIAQLVSAWQGEEWKGRVSYPHDFDLSDLATELGAALDSQSLGISPTFDKEVKKQVARRMLGHGVSQATMAEIDGEIEAGADPYAQRIRGAAAAGATQ